MDEKERQLLMDVSQPDQGVVATLAQMQGDLLLLGAGGKIGHGLALMALRAFDQAGKRNKVIAVSRFQTAGVRKQLKDDGITTISCDLTDAEAVSKLPDAPDVVYLAGQKFGTTDSPGATWVLNAYMPAIVAQRWGGSRFVVFSSGNVYAYSSPASGGPTEEAEPQPLGEYAITVLGRERIFEHFSRQLGTKATIIRLNYANEPRYGVLVDIATRLLADEPVDVTAGCVNLVWQGDSNRVTLECFRIAASPPTILNLSGPATVPIRELATKLAKALGVEAKFVGKEKEKSLISNGSLCWRTFGAPKVSVDEMIQRVAAWLKEGRPTMGKPTHFEATNGKY